MPDWFDYTWKSKKRLPERRGEECRVAEINTRTQEVLVEFRDGERHWVSRAYVRRKHDAPKRPGE